MESVSNSRRRMNLALANGHRGKAAIEASPEKPLPLAVNPDGIPLRLRELPQWVCWRWERRQGKTPGEHKWTKPRINPRSGNHADVASGTRASWLPFAEALDYLHASKADGIGFVFQEQLPFFGADLDDCRNPETGEVAAWAQDIIHRLN